MFSNQSNHQVIYQKTQLHKELDKFIQNCLSKFKFVEPQKDFYNIVDKERKSIISYKSTIPDLVIWNQTFNKNECFIDSDLSKKNPFPRFQFFLLFSQCKTKKKRKNKKNKNKDKKEKSSSQKNNMKNNTENNVEINDEINEYTPYDESKTSENFVNLIKQIDLKDKNGEQSQEHDDNISNEKKDENSKSSQTSKNKIDIPDNSNVIEVNSSQLESNDLKINTENSDNNNKINNQISFNYVDSLKTNNASQNILNNIALTQNSSLPNNNYPKRISSYNNNYMNYNQNSKNQNKFSMPPLSIIKNKKSINDYYQNQFKQNELLMNLVYSYLEKKGWIIFKNNGNYISNFTSFELFTFLTNILKNNGDLKLLMIGMLNNSMMFNGEQIYIILSQTLPIIFQKKQYELMQSENMKKLNMKEKEKENISDKDSQDGINYNLSLYDNNYEEDNKDDCGINDDDNNCFNFNNNFFSSQPEGNIYDNFDSSIFSQSK